MKSVILPQKKYNTITGYIVIYRLFHFYRLPTRARIT